MSDEKQPTLLEKIEGSLITGEDAQRTFDNAFLKKLLWEHKDKEPIDIINFLHKAQLSGADPRTNEIYLVGYFDKKRGKMACNTIFSYHFLLKQAAKSKAFKGVDVRSEPKDVFDPITGETKTMLVAVARTMRDDCEITFEARWNEFFQPFNPIWKSKPHLMLEKCAVANVLRRAFPDVGINDMFIDGEQHRPDYVETEKVNKSKQITDEFSDVIPE